MIARPFFAKSDMVYVADFIPREFCTVLGFAMLKRFQACGSGAKVV